jgi:hypothetical protein
MGIGAEDDLLNRPSHHDDGEEHGHDDFESFVISGVGSTLDKSSAQLKAALTRSGRNGVWRSLIPVASNTALPTAAAVGQVAGSPAP